MESVWIGNDHGGYELKLKILSFLTENGFTVRDVGTHSNERVSYPYFARKVAGAVSEGIADKGILICTTGIGMSIVANKYKRVRASLCTSVAMSKMTRAHNNSNILCLGGINTGHDYAIEMLKTWLSTEYESGRHEKSLKLIVETEDFLIPDPGAAKTRTES